MSKSGEQVIYSEPEWDKNQMYLNMMSDFALYAVDDRPHYADLEQAIQVVGMVDAIRQKALWKKS